MTINFIEESDEDDEPPARRRRMAERAAEGEGAEDEVSLINHELTQSLAGILQSLSNF